MDQGAATDRLRNLTDSKRRVITLLRKNGPLTKRDLTKHGHMSWATAVKAIDQLSDDGIVQNVGLSSRDPGRRGKTAYLYALSSERPLAIGIDVEYSTTTVVLTDLTGQVITNNTHKTPQQVDDATAKDFLSFVIRDFMLEHELNSNDLDGIGIGLPGIGFPSSSIRDNIRKAQMLEHHLGDMFGMRIRVETNTKAYAVFEKWANSTFSFTDFIFVAIRTGVGTGIFCDGSLFTGPHGLAGEIGHMKVVPNGPPCRCGSSGCLETVVNQSYLYQQYRTNVLEDDSPLPDWPGKKWLFQGLEDLFTKAKRGDEAAVRIVNAAATYLGYGIANAITVLDITNIIISGYFGPNGDAMLPVLDETIRERILPKVDFTVKYVPFDPTGHVRGAALLVLGEYFVDIPRDGARSTEPVLQV